MTNLALLSLAAAQTLAASIPTRPLSCGLSPWLGRGHSALGKIDQVNAVAASCSYTLWENESYGFRPSVGFDQQTYSIERSQEGANYLDDFQSRNLSLGFQALKKWGAFEVYYSFAYARGQGQLERTASDAQSTLTIKTRNLKHQRQAHGLGLAYAWDERIVLSGALEQHFGSDSWDPQTSRFAQEMIDGEKRLTLTSGRAGDFGPAEKSNNYQATVLKLGVSLRIP